MLYDVKSPFSQGLTSMDRSADALRSMTKKTSPPPKTAGGALMSGAGGALVGAELGGLLSTSALAGPVGAGVGLAVGIGSYLL